MVTNDCPALMRRRYFLRTVCLAAVAATLPRPARAAEAAKRKPNVLFIAIDDLNDWIGCLGGHPQSRTPNLDRLAKRGVLFTSAHCAAPACNPSRAALMTGILPSTSGVYHNPQPWRKSPVLKDAATLPQYFMANGYEAIGGGKIYHGSFPDPPSWNSYFPDQKRNKPPDPNPPKTNINGLKKGHFDWGPVTAGDEEMGDFKVVSWAARQMKTKRAKPLFLACGLYRPHLPWYVPRKYFDMFPVDDIQLPKVKEDDLDDVPPIGRKVAKPQGDHKAVTGNRQWKLAVQGYLASIAFTDAQIGRLIEAFDAGQLGKDTVLVLWSDHGWHLGEKLHWRKFSLWEEATHNVLMFVAPGVTKPRGVCKRPVGLIDIYPTLVELCGLPIKKELEGVSLVPLLKNPSANWDRPALTTHGRNCHSLRSQRWRYIRYSDGTEELYDHDKDPMEWTNLAADPQYAEIKKAHAKFLPKTNAPESQRGKKGTRTGEKKAK